MATPETATNPLLGLLEHGQSAWYDYIRRGLIASGELGRLIAEDGLRGVTSNPAIWEKAIDGSTDYADAIADLKSGGTDDPVAIYEAIATQDLRDAADAFRPIYDETGGADGFVSIEVAPEHAHDTETSIAEGERLWKMIDRENLMIKIPATQEGIPAIRALLARGINVNITLLFANDVYEQVAEAFIAGLSDHAADGGDPAKVASVASFFVSRIDTQVDAQLEDIGTDRARALEGRVAIANAKLAYQRYKKIFAGERWDALAERGARAQRLLWASTGVKNPKYRDVLYVEELIGPETVNTIPPATFDAFRDHGRPRASLEEDVDGASATLDELAELGVSLEEITTKLTEDGVDLFCQAFDKLFAAISQSHAADPDTYRGAQRASLPDEIGKAVDEKVADWDRENKVRRLWARDASVWTGDDEDQWLGWLGVAEDQLADIARLEQVSRDASEGAFEHAVVLGMGGSSLFPALLAGTFDAGEGHPELRVLDSTDPAQVQAMADGVDLSKTLFFVSSKSGTTLEPNIFCSYFLERVSEAVGEDEAPNRFIAITDPGSELEKLAHEKGFRRVAHGVKSIGGRYSALSNFGMVPGAAAGIDVHELLDRAKRMAHSCAPCAPAAHNAGLVLGATIGACANAGRDKVTLVASPGIHDLGAWLEQLLAESTGKEGKGVIPVDREPVGAPDDYGDDRLFAYMRLTSGADPEQDAAVEALAGAGHPVVTIELDDELDIGAEVFRWEFATAVAGSVIGINPFNQPDVEAAKVAARELTSEYEKSGSLPAEDPIASGDGLTLFADDRNASELRESAGGEGVGDLLAAHLGRVGAGDYVALLAYVQMTEEHEAVLTEIRGAVRDRTRAATCVGFGPRFQHSTGQAYKGGPNSGVFCQITCDDAANVPVPGHEYTFGVVKAAQARGDLQVLAERGRRALRIHIGEDVAAGLAQVREAISKALR